MPVAAQLEQSLRERIVSLELEPGSVLSRVALAEEYGVSKTPIRDAIQRLEQQGLVVVEPQASTYVAPIDIDKAFETQFLRTALECEVARALISRMDAGKLAHLQDISERMARSRGEQEQADFRSLDQAFHRQLFRAVNREGLWDLIEQKGTDINRLRNLDLLSVGKIGRIISEHNAILHAYATRDLDAVIEAIREHLSGTLGAVDKIRMNNPSRFFK
jgi:DNA-binding GntR family transcriptional regulator